MGGRPDDPPDRGPRSAEPTAVAVTLSTPASGSGSGEIAGVSAPSSVAFLPDQLVEGRYRIIRFIAQGGMGEVYEAEDQALHGVVALKTIRPGLSKESRAVERFKREIHIARRITHPNVCRIYDIGLHRRAAGESGPEEVLFLTMELLPGQSLRETISRKGRLATDEALPLIEQMAAGLDEAHALGVIHRDFKSANVVLVLDARKGLRAVVTDFGLARVVTPTQGAADESHESFMSLSDTGAIVGTPAYMAPEQVQGRALTPAADIYALGIVIYEMVTGVRPFGGDSPLSMAVKRLTEPPPPPRTHCPDLDPKWEAAILRCLERNPEDRFATAGDVAKALRGDDAAPTVPHATRVRRSRSSWKLAAVALVLLLAGAAGYVGIERALQGGRSAAGTRAAPVAVRPSVAVLPLRNLSGGTEASWLSTAIAQWLTMTLTAGGVRAIPAEDVVRAEADLDLPRSSELPAADIRRIRENLGAALIVDGSYSVLQGGLIRIDGRLIAADGGALATATATGTASQLFALVSRFSGPLREKLNLPALSPAQAVEVEASLPAGADAMRSYAEGLERLGADDLQSARDRLEKATAADPGHPLPHAALSMVWSRLGDEDRAKGEARKAVELSGRLSAQDRLRVAAQTSDASRDWDKAIESYRALFTAFPDDIGNGLRLAAIQTAAGRAKEALVTIAAVRGSAGASPDDPRVDLEESRAHQELGNPAEARTLATKAAEKAVKRGARSLVARARLLEASALDSLGETDQALAAAEESRKLYEASRDRSGAARALERLALSLDSKGDKEGARRIYERALAIHREIGDRGNAARVLANLGTVLFELGRIPEAQRLYDDSLATFRQIGAKYEEAATLTDIGARLQNEGDLAAAEKRYKQALEIFSGIGNKRGQAATLTNLAEVFFARGELDQARDMHQESLALNREIGDKPGAAYDLHRLGEVFATKGDLHVARARYEEALALQGQIGDKISRAETTAALARLALVEGRAAEAEPLAREAEEVLRAENASESALLAQAVLVEVLLAQGKLDEARKIMESAAKAAETSTDKRVRFSVTAAGARVRAASKTPDDRALAVRDLEKALAEARQGGFLGWELELRLALGQVQGGAAGRDRLEALKRDAQTKGFGLIARSAEKALGT